MIKIADDSKYEFPRHCEKVEALQETTVAQLSEEALNSMEGFGLLKTLLTVISANPRDKP